MGVKVATGCCNLTRNSVLHSPQALASAISSPSRRNLTAVALLYRPAIFGIKLNRSPSSEILRISRKHLPIKRAVSANLEAEFSDEEFSKKILELAQRFQVSDHDVDDHNSFEVIKPETEKSNLFTDPPDWPPEDMIPASIERKANSVELPFSLRIIKRKKQWQEGFREAGESAYCSVKKAFSSMVFIIRELQSYTLQMRELLFLEDLQGILARVQKEMNASFVWLFQQVFSQTPTLMVYVMILLANYSVYSMSSNVAFAAASPVAAVESVSTVEYRSQSQSQTKFQPSHSGGKTTSVGGINGGGGKFRPVASGTDGDGKFDGSVGIISDGSSLANLTRGSEESVSGREEETGLWDSMVNEAYRMMIGDGGFDHETMKRFVAPVSVRIEEEDTDDHLKTELLYQRGLSNEPNNPLLLANYAQFLYVVAHDYDRAEDYFKKASQVEPKDAEALSKYACFLWQARNDLWAAEETYLEAISADPNNPYYAANYAHFLWTTGGEDTCFPLDSPENVNFDDA